PCLPDPQNVASPVRGREYGVAPSLAEVVRPSACHRHLVGNPTRLRHHYSPGNGLPPIQQGPDHLRVHQNRLCAHTATILSSSAMVLTSTPPHHSGRLARTRAVAKGGGTALPHRATCLLLP